MACFDDPNSFCPLNLKSQKSDGSENIEWTIQYNASKQPLRWDMLGSYQMDGLQHEFHNHQTYNYDNSSGRYLGGETWVQSDDQASKLHSITYAEYYED